ADWLKANPKDGVFRVYIAERRLAAKEYRAAVEQYQVLLTNNPKDTLALNNLAWALGQLKDPKAIDYAERARALAPNSPAILDTLAMIMLDRGDKARAVELLRQALMLAPNAQTIRMDLATALARSGQQEGARRELEPLLKLDDKDPAHIAAAALMRSL
ncbi:MAG: tetratricopeptide repeat protein, partial [Hyphomicrobiales bacterium]|nr:tetratricopeptide repeat protein [Hyphomicrobiales bacterium]